MGIYIMTSQYAQLKAAYSVAYGDDYKKLGTGEEPLIDTIDFLKKKEASDDDEQESARRVTNNSPDTVKKDIERALRDDNNEYQIINTDKDFLDADDKTKQHVQAVFTLVGETMKNFLNLNPLDKDGTFTGDGKYTERAKLIIRRYNHLVYYLNEHLYKKGGIFVSKTPTVTSLDFLPIGGEGMYDVPEGEIDPTQLIKNVIHANQSVTMNHIFPGMYAPGEGMVGGGAVDRISYCSDNKYLRNHFDNQNAALENANIKLSKTSKTKVEALFTKLENIQFRLCNIIKQRDIAIHSEKYLSTSSKDKIHEQTGENSYEFVINDLLKSLKSANAKVFGLNLTLDKVIHDQLTKALIEHDARGTDKPKSVDTKARAHMAADSAAAAAAAAALASTEFGDRPKVETVETVETVESPAAVARKKEIIAFVEGIDLVTGLSDDEVDEIARFNVEGTTFPNSTDMKTMFEASAISSTMQAIVLARDEPLLKDAFKRYFKNKLNEKDIILTDSEKSA